MKAILDVNRLIRLRMTDGMPLHDIIDNKMVVKSDWVTFCGATYRDKSRTWSKRLDGSLVYVGPDTRHGG